MIHPPGGACLLRGTFLKTNGCPPYTTCFRNEKFVNVDDFPISGIYHVQRPAVGLAQTDGKVVTPPGGYLKERRLNAA